jgi:predicted nuclease of predicted toxin-antitoxin system
MKLLFDQNISHRIIPNIQDIFPNAMQVRELGLENLADKEIWDYAKKNEFVIVTFDMDFYDLSVIWGNPPKIIWIRTFN